MRFYNVNLIPVNMPGKVLQKLFAQLESALRLKGSNYVLCLFGTLSNPVVIYVIKITIENFSISVA